jgi:ABC-type Fe3+/spermidine/putrescine transport system ATPase subunit
MAERKAATATRGRKSPEEEMTAIEKELNDLDQQRMALKEKARALTKRMDVLLLKSSLGGTDLAQRLEAQGWDAGTVKDAVPDY